MKKAKASDLGPHKITKNDWFYEERTGLLLVHEVYSPLGNYICTEQVKLPWRKLEASLKRWQARKRRAAKKS
jgi:hypothetical protein